jgi:hypothetical protein
VGDLCILFDLSIAWDHYHQLPFRGGDKVLQLEMTLPFGCPSIAQRQQAGKSPIGVAIRRIDSNVRCTVRKDEPSAHNQPEVGIVAAQLLGRCERTTPERELRSHMPMPDRPKPAACATISKGWLAPRRKEKLVAARSSA